MENYSAPTRWLWFMYSNLELFRVQKACLYTAAEDQIANRTTTFTLALFGSKLTSAWAAGPNGPQHPSKQSGETGRKTPKILLHPRFFPWLWGLWWWKPVFQQSPCTAAHHPSPTRSQAAVPSLEHPTTQQLLLRWWFLTTSSGARKQRHLSITRSVTTSNSLPIFLALKQTTSFTWLAWHRIALLRLDWHLLHSSATAAASERCCTVGRVSSLPNKSWSHMSCLQKLQCSACSWILSSCLPFASVCSHPSLAFSLSYSLKKEPARRTAEGSSQRGMLAEVLLIWGYYS